jgi:uncharacterized protein YlaI
VVLQRAARDDPAVETDRTANGEVHVLACAECPRVSSATAAGWRGYRSDDPETEPPRLAFFCPECARREFGDV